MPVIAMGIMERETIRQVDVFMCEHYTRCHPYSIAVQHGHTQKHPEFAPCAIPAAGSRAENATVPFHDVQDGDLNAIS
jgi:hypothetical protein